VTGRHSEVREVLSHVLDWMHRMGHASIRAALIYQHATSDRDLEIAKELSWLAIAAREKGRAGSPTTRAMTSRTTVLPARWCRWPIGLRRLSIYWRGVARDRVTPS
jgi:hypothetical protein